MSTKGLVPVYDLVAEQYLAQLGDELAGKPFDRLVLRHFAEHVGDGVVVDLGCGPGHVTRFLKDAGAAGVRGVDLSPAMVTVAQREQPDISFAVGDMRSLDARDGSWDAIVAFYSIVHIPTHQLAGPFLELARVVRPGGRLLLSFHIGTHSKHLDEWWGHEVDIDFVFHDRRAVAAILKQTGWRVIDAMERPPYGEDVEYPSQRAYLVAERVERAMEPAGSA
ncbi:MAG: class I SAM-dependent methyltransferase [Deltaproteobacteria bacterium]|nr:class I SAM-dependent methyltransferase [Deltaproteobacteria bacterium]